jgi:hypothetical protein
MDSPLPERESADADPAEGLPMNQLKENDHGIEQPARR